MTRIFGSSSEIWLSK